MQKIVIAISIIFILPSLSFAVEHRDGHEPNWENLSIGMLSLILDQEENSLEDFTIDGGKKQSLRGRKGFTCNNLVARFLPDEYPKINSRFELRRACEKAKEVARQKIEWFRENPRFIVSHYTEIGDYDFEKKRFPIKKKYREGRGVNIPEKYKKLEADWPTAYGSGAYNFAEHEAWCLGQFWLKHPHPIESFYMEPEEAEEFEKRHGKVFVRYEFSLKAPRSGAITLSQSDKITRMWLYESEKMENLLAIRFPDRNWGRICDLNFARNTKNHPDDRVRRIREMRGDPCQEYKIGGQLK